MKQKYSPNTRHVILDSNIIQYLNNPLLQKGILNSCREAAGSNYALAISDFSFFEILNGITPERELEMMGVLNELVRLHVRKDTLIASAHLGCLYKDDGLNLDHIDNGDLIIAASSVLTNSLIYTANVRDFPAPFF